MCYVYNMDDGTQNEKGNIMKDKTFEEKMDAAIEIYTKALQEMVEKGVIMDEAQTLIQKKNNAVQK